MPHWKATKPKDDREYFESMTTHLFSAGLNWKVVDNKRRGFERAFANFDPANVAKFGERDVVRLMKDTGIVRNERKIRSTIYNAGEMVRVASEYGSFRNYISRFGENEKGLQQDLQDRFQHMGPATTRMFLWSVGHRLTPTAEEKKWMASHEM